jgi:PHD/YefM family antitoxin component YafN of YafNO toxin-antitoxin module
MDTRTLDDPNDIRALAQEARREPIVVMQGGEPAFVALSIDEFARLQDVDRERRRAAGQRLSAIMDQISRRTAQELTPKELAQLERDIIDED